MLSLLITAAPVIFKLIDWLWEDKEQKAKARIRFLKYIESHKHYTKKPVEMRNRYIAIRQKAEQEVRKMNEAKVISLNKETSENAGNKQQP